MLLAAYAAAATGLPLRGPAPPRAAAERFPCEDCGCGCGSAEVCWTNCCCNSLSERLAWAAREDIRPPQHVLSKAQCAGHDVSRWIPTASPVTLVAEAAEPKKKACCCCAKKSAPTPNGQSDREQDSSDGSQGWRSLTCNGVLSLWVSLSVALPPAEDESPALPRAVATRLAAAPLFDGCSFPPATPPPDAAS
ncbi:hypothetical protein Pla123a_36970 [Posidoniimonas polymericola]|uniref:Uncharacterized protein n=1 Tax=Posidoniimonas polymericola TaxID=2528002 RepID=A0A5C5YG17_9BACT|nr:hypothetical protein Pla123a_36970 [Posidoniimonas polymericola]